MDKSDNFMRQFRDITGSQDVKNITASQLLIIWDHYDLDGNGFLEGDELDHFLREFVTSVTSVGSTEVISQTMFNELKTDFMDAYDDNEDGRIEIRELVNMLPTDENFLLIFQLDNRITSGVDFMEIWHKYDEDRSGCIDGAELKNFLADLIHSSKPNMKVSDEKLDEYVETLDPVFNENGGVIGLHKAADETMHLNMATHIKAIIVAIQDDFDRQFTSENDRNAITLPENRINRMPTGLFESPRNSINTGGSSAVAKYDSGPPTRPDQNPANSVRDTRTGRPGANGDDNSLVDNLISKGAAMVTNKLGDYISHKYHPNQSGRDSSDRGTHGVNVNDFFDGLKNAFLDNDNDDRNQRSNRNRDVGNGNNRNYDRNDGNSSDWKHVANNRAGYDGRGGLDGGGNRNMDGDGGRRGRQDRDDYDDDMFTVNNMMRALDDDLNDDYRGRGRLSPTRTGTVLVRPGDRNRQSRNMRDDDCFDDMDSMRFFESDGREKSNAGTDRGNTSAMRDTGNRGGPVNYGWNI